MSGCVNWNPVCPTFLPIHLARMSIAQVHACVKCVLWLSPRILTAHPVPAGV